MRVEITEAGPVVRAEDVAPLLGLDPAALPRLMREGRVSCLHERGEGEDAGRFRMTFRHGEVRLRLTCAADGTVLKRLRAAAPDRGGA